MKNKFPWHIVLWLVVCSFALGADIVLLILRYVYKIYMIEPYFIMCSIPIAATLFFTAAVAVKDWQKTNKF